ncbi:hypothetical protein JXA40_08525 [bacterium]|nr:hypothetical protein [candidate division CSSED10-310 bacterium]
MTSWINLPALMVFTGFLAISAKTWGDFVSSANRSRWLDGGIFALSQLMFVSCILGTIKILNVKWLLLGNGILTLLVFLALRKKKVSKTDRSGNGMDSRNVGPLALMPILLGFAMIFSSILMGPGGDDVWCYHLAFPAEWVNWQDLRCTVQAFGDQGPPFYPQHGGIIAHVLMAFLKSDFLARFHQVPMWIFGLCALAFGIRQTGRSWNGAWMGAALVGLMPIVAGCTNLALSDISLAGAAALLFYTIPVMDADGPHRAALTSGLALGLMVGFKGYGAYYALPFIIWIILRLKVWTKRGGSLGLILIAGLMASGSYWHMRNWWWTSNPVFPYQVEFLNHVVFPGIYTRAHMIHLGFHRLAYFDQFRLTALWNTLGPSGFLIVAAALVNFFLRSIRRKISWLDILPFVILIQFFFMPYRYHPRLFMPALWFCAPAAAVLWDGLQINRKNIWSVVFVAFIILFSPNLPVNRFLLSPILLIAAVGIPMIIERIKSGSPFFLRLAIIIAVGSIILISLFFPGICNHYERHKWEGFAGEMTDLARWISSVNEKNLSFNIAFTGLNIPYPLFGPNLVNTVRYLQRNGDAEASWYGDRAYAGIAADLNAEAWRRAVIETRTNLIVIGTYPGAPTPPEYHWIQSLDSFEPAYCGTVFKAWISQDLLIQYSENLVDHTGLPKPVPKS